MSIEDEEVSDKPVADTRRRNFFWADNNLLDEAGATIGATPVAVYCVLARHAGNETRVTWPAVESICKKLSISKPTARKALQTLADHNLIRVEERFVNKTGPQLSNRYYLLDVSEWTLPQGKDSFPRQKEKAKSRGKNLSPAPKESLPELNTANKTTNTSKHNNEAAPVVADVNNPLSHSDAATTEETAQLAKALEGFRVTVERSQYLAKRFPERARLCVDYWTAHSADLAKKDKPGGAVASSIETPEKWPQITAWRAVPSPVASSTQKPAKVAPEKLAAAQRVFDALPANVRESYLLEGKDVFGLVTRIYANELALEMRQK